MKKDIQKIIKRELVKETFDWDQFLRDAKSEINTAKSKFLNFINKVRDGYIPGLDEEDAEQSITSNLKGSGLVNDAVFATRLKEVASNLRVSPNDLIRVMKKESGMNPKAMNSRTGAVGLIQLMPATCQKLGVSPEDIRNMPAVQQLDYVEKYFQPYIGKMNNYTDLYMATFFPALLGKPDDMIIQSKNLSAQLISRQNPVIARAAGKEPGQPLTISDFKTYARAV